VDITQGVALDYLGVGFFAVFVAAAGLGAPLWASSAAGVIAGVGLRGGALLWGWRLPGFSPPEPG